MSIYDMDYKQKFLDNIDLALRNAPDAPCIFPIKEIRQLTRKLFSVSRWDKQDSNRSETLSKIRKLESVYAGIPRVKFGPYRIINTKQSLEKFKKRMSRLAAKYFHGLI